MNRAEPNVGQASSLPGERASASGSVPSALPTGAGRMPALLCGSCRASIWFRTRIGTMNWLVLVLVVLLVLENVQTGWVVEDEHEEEDEWPG